MILNSLVDYYENLIEHEKIPEDGWSNVKVSFALWIDDSGEIERVTSLKMTDGKKSSPSLMKVPEQVLRSSGVSPNFLCDNSSYCLGVDNKGKPERAKDCFRAAGELYKKILGGLHETAVCALLQFFETWNPENFFASDVFLQFRDDIIQGGNIVFCYKGTYIHQFEDVKRAWKEYKLSESGDNKSLCLVTGKEDTTARVHPLIKGIKNSQTSGASLVSFNAPSFCSFGKEQGTNAPIGETAAKAYGTALNYLISNINYKQYIGDTAVLAYSSNGDEVYQSALDVFLFGEDSSYTEEELQNMIADLCQGKTVVFNESKVDPSMEFFILGLAPNAARLSVRFFLRNRFGTIIQNIRQHQERLELVGGVNEKHKYVPVWRILKETYRDGGSPSPVLAGELLQAILSNGKYPATLINAVDIRIRADRDINEVRAAVIKAYYLKNRNKNISKEVLTVALNKETNDVAYNLGRLFSILEMVQKSANNGINATIKDKFFVSASATPAAVFPYLIDLSQNHLRKLGDGSRIFYEKQIGEIMDKFGGGFPRILNMPERGAFQLGYYHQVQENYKKNEKGGE